MIFKDRAEWLAWRHKGIGSSDAAAVHDKSRFGTRFELWETKCKAEYVETPTGWAQEKGNELEVKGRIAFAAEYNMVHGTSESFSPRNVQMTDLPFMLASLDGASNDLTIIMEHKYMGREKHAAVNNGALPLTHETDPCRVPYDYWIQVQHQLLVSGARLCYFRSKTDVGEPHEAIIKPDVKFMSDHLEACIEFWESVQTRKAPALSEKDYKELKKRGAKGKVQKWKRLELRIKEMKAEQDELRDAILDLVDHPRMTCEGVSILFQANGNAGGIDYERILALPEVCRALMDNDIDLNKYRKPNSKPYYKMKA